MGELANRFKFSGGSIRNVLLSAAFLAARDGKKIAMGHLLWGRVANSKNSVSWWMRISLPPALSKRCAVPREMHEPQHDRYETSTTE